MPVAEVLLSAEEYALRPNDGLPTELVRGRIVTLNVPLPRHGEICVNVVLYVGSFVKEQDLGRVVSNDSGVLTERDPDTVRGADVAYYSYKSIPKGPLPQRYLTIPPELIFEVRSPSDRWREVLAKVAEYLQAGVQVVCVLDPQTVTATLYFADQPSQTLTAAHDFCLPELLPGLRIRVERFFE